MGSNTSQQISQQIQTQQTYQNQSQQQNTKRQNCQKPLLSHMPFKANFQYIQPIFFENDQLPCSTKQLSQTQICQNKVKTSQEKSDTTINSTKQIKIKWNSFIKIKQKNYLQEYTIIKNVIGKGGFGVVRKVQSNYNGEIKVAKVIKKKSMKEDDLKKLMVQLFIMKQLDHPNLVKLYEVYDFQNQIILILQMCSGGEILKSIKGKKLSQKKIAQIVKQILRVFIYIHSQKIVHRDIKPQNILFETQECKNIKIIDFGIAVRFTVGQFLQQRIGTPNYIAPQIIYKKYNQKCDIWAVGITMYQMICGKPPFQGQNQLQLMRQILRCDLQFKGSVWSKISKQCKDLIKLMLKKSADERPSAKELFNNKYFQQFDEQNIIQDNNHQEQKQEVFQNIQRFKFKNKLQAVVQTFIASQLLTKQQKQTLIQIFKTFDSNNDGVISTAELQIALQSRGDISKQRLKVLVKAIDTNGSGQIDYTQFLVAGFDNNQIMTRDRLKKVFQYFDTDHSGAITYEQVVQFLQDYQSSQEQIKKMFLQVDRNCNGQISQDQFIQLLLKKVQTLKSIQFDQKSVKKQRIQKLSCIIGVNQLVETNVKTKKKSNFCQNKGKDKQNHKEK